MEISLECRGAIDRVLASLLGGLVDSNTGALAKILIDGVLRDFGYSLTSVVVVRRGILTYSLES